LSVETSDDYPHKARLEEHRQNQHNSGRQDTTTVRSIRLRDLSDAENGWLPEEDCATPYIILYGTYKHRQGGEAKMKGRVVNQIDADTYRFEMITEIVASDSSEKYGLRD